MSLMIRTFINKWKDILTLLSVIVGLSVFLMTSSRLSGKQEQLLTDVKETSDKTLQQVTVNTGRLLVLEVNQKILLDNKTDQDAINKNVTSALTKINLNVDRTAEILRALGVDHAKLMKMHGLYPEGDKFLPEIVKPPEKMKPFGNVSKKEYKTFTVK